MIAQCFSCQTPHPSMSQDYQVSKQLSSTWKWQRNIRWIGRTPSRFSIWWKPHRSWLARQVPPSFSWCWPTWMVRGHSLCWCIDSSFLVSQRRMKARLSSKLGIPSGRQAGRASLIQIYCMPGIRSTRKERLQTGPLLQMMSTTPLSLTKEGERT